MSEEKNSISMKELAAKLKIADALLKKIVKDFDIPTAKVKSRVHLEDSSVQTVREIMALRASGKKTKEIKELFDASKETTKPELKENTSAPEKKEAIDTSTTNQVKKKKILVEKQENTVAEVEITEDSEPVTTEEVKKPLDTRTPEEIEEARARAKAKSNKRKAKIKKAKAARELNAKNLEGKYADAHDTEDDHKNSMMNLNEYLDSNETDNDFKANLNINENDSDLEEDLSIDSIDDDDEDDDDEDDDDPKSDSKTKTTNKKAKIRRRQFSYKYIQRQIMNDQKRVQYIQQKLQRGRLSTKEKMELEESLEIRDKLLAGWVKLLRWVKS